VQTPPAECICCQCLPGSGLEGLTTQRVESEVGVRLCHLSTPSVRVADTRIGAVEDGGKVVAWRWGVHRRHVGGIAREGGPVEGSWCAGVAEVGGGGLATCCAWAHRAVDIRSTAWQVDAGIQVEGDQVVNSRAG